MIPDSEYNMVALAIFVGFPAVIFMMIVWNSWCEVQRNRKRRSYQNHPSQRKDLYQQRNRGTVQK